MQTEGQFLNTSIGREFISSNRVDSMKSYNTQRLPKESEFNKDIDKRGHIGKKGEFTSNVRGGSTRLSRELRRLN